MVPALDPAALSHGGLSATVVVAQLRSAAIDLYAIAGVEPPAVQAMLPEDPESAASTSPSASSSTERPQRASSSGMFSAGTTCVRLPLTKGSRPRVRQALVRAAIGALACPVAL